MQRAGSFSSDVSHQHQLQDLLLLAHTQREQNVVPRVDGVRHTHSSTTSIELTLLRTHPEASTRCELAITLAIRLPEGFPLEAPMIACVAGGEFLPPSLCEDGQLSVAWLHGGWPQGYTLVNLAQDLCAELATDEQERVRGRRCVDAFAPRPASPPLLLLVDSPPKLSVPSAPTYHGDYEGNQQPAFIGRQSPSSPMRASVTFKVKWRESQCQFQASPPPSLAGLLVLLRQYIPSIASCTSSPQLVEFNSTRSGALLSTDKNWHALLQSHASTFFILINESPPSAINTEAGSVDLLGLHDDTAASMPLVHPLRSPLPIPSPSKALACAPRSPEKNSHQQRSCDDMSIGNVRRIPWSELQIGGIIGNGSSCRVYNATWRGTDVAVKVFTGNNRSSVEKEFSNEVATMARLGAHPSLVLFLAVTQQPLSIVFEYLPFSLFELINGVDDKTRKLPPFPSSWTKRVTMMLDIAKGLQFLHSFDIIHRDMKSLNLLVTPEGRVKLADFGISRVAQPSAHMTGCCGTYQWMAPEVLQSAAYSVSADIYSFGIIMWEICEAAPPFADLTPALVPAAVLRDKKRPQFSPRTPQPLQELAQQCWQEDAAKRPSAAHIAAVLSGFFHHS